MQRKLLIGLVAALMLVLVVSVAAYAQGNTLKEYTGYQVMNLATCNTCEAHVRIEYYKEDGTLAKPAFTKIIPPGGSANVQQKTDDTDLNPGVYSAVLSSDQPIAAVVGQVMSDPSVPGNVFQTPLSDYTGVSAGSTTVSLPAIDLNWFGFDSIARIQNVGDSDAHISVQFKAANVGGTLAGQASIPAKTFTIKKYAAITLDPNVYSSELAATSGSFQGRFYGSAVVTSDQLLAAIANETNVASRLKFTYNGFGDADSGTELLAPGIYYNWYGTYTTFAVANPTSNTCTGTITYTAGANSQLVGGANGDGQTLAVPFTLAPGEARTAQEAINGSISDLKAKFQRFGGGARVTSTCKLVAKVNQSQYSPRGNGQDPAGSFNAIPTSGLTTKVAVPLIQADFYGYFTSLTCSNADTANAANVAITYTSDSLSGVQTTATVNHTVAAGGTLIVYEGQFNGQFADINKTGSPWYQNGTAKFNGSAFVTSTGGKIACVVNEEGPNAPGDNLLSYNGVSINP